MSYEAEAANMVIGQAVKLGFEGAEILLKLTGTGAKHLAVLLAALLKDEKKWAGATKLKRMFRDGKPLRVIQIPSDKLKEFGETAKRHGVLFHGFKDTNDQGICNIFIKAEDAALVNRVLASAKIKAVELASVEPTVREKDRQSPTRPEAGNLSAPSSGTITGIEVGYPHSVEAELINIKNGAMRPSLSPEEAKAIIADPGYVFQDAGRYKNYLEMQGRLYNYSDNNMKLILSQHPDATMVASRNRWRQMGRGINENATPISIMVPVQGEDGKTEFATGEVFDISDTSGAAIPMPEAPREGSQELSALIQALDQSMPVQVKYDPAAEAAVYSPEVKAVILNTAMPWGLILVKSDPRTMTTESAAVLMPFRAQEIMQSGGIYYGVNSISKNLIIVDRTKLLNGNGFIIGVSGSGKSFFSKREIAEKALTTEDDILILDPQREYWKLVQQLGGEVISIGPSANNHINALDMSKDYGGGENPIGMKSDFILSLCEQFIGAGKLTAKDKSIIDRCVSKVYHGHIERGYNNEQAPTLVNFYTELERQREPEAKSIALAVELYAKGSLNTFAQPTNVDVDNRLIVYDIKDLGNHLKTVGMLVVLDAIFSRIMRNYSQGRRTWVYIDEIYLLFANEYSSHFLYELWKRVRKYGGFCTGITQNVTDLLQSENARTMLANSEILIMLNQAATDRLELATLLNISDTQMSYITNPDAGQGLLRCAGSIVPFEDKFPKNTTLYKLMTTKPDEQDEIKQIAG